VLSVKSDSQDQPVYGNPHFDTISIRVLDDQSIEKTEKKSGRTVAASKIVVSPDANSAVFEFIDTSGGSADPVIIKGSMTRLPRSKRPAGSHAISGSWRVSKIESISDNALAFTFKLENDNLSMTSSTGRSYTAKLDGTDGPYKGDTTVNGVSVVRQGKDTFVETDKHDGKPIRTMRIMVAPEDGKTVSVIVTDNLGGAAIVLVANKQ
jgi:hypothetical protein